MKRARGYQRRGDAGRAAGSATGKATGRTAGRAPGAVRIVGGRWRGRRIRVADVRGLRPTAGRTRETLFNWLQGRVTGARVLDLFAGSGALAFEALSRGAVDAVLVEQDRKALTALREATAALTGTGASSDGEAQAPAIRIVAADVERWLTGTPPAEPFDLVFADPPFTDGSSASPLLDSTLRALAAPGWLADDARVYVEWPAVQDAPWGADWAPLRETRAGDSRGALLARAAASEDGSRS